tara:strand:+ start:1005 stop:1577 length:573 start_codon:yes stop_codon:yes gene_type:complete
MFTKTEIKQNFLGCLEIFLFMRKGIERFGTSNVSAVKSFIVPLALLPFSLLAIMAVQSETPLNTLIGIKMGHLAITAILFLAFVYYFMKQYDRQQHFWRFITISNWLSIPSMILLLPLLVGRLTGIETTAFESYIIFTAIINYVYLAFILTNCFRLPWELGGFIAIVSLAINEHTLKIGAVLHENFMALS